MINEFRPMNHLTSLQNLICTIGNLPTSYVLSLSYEEQIWWLCDFLDKKVFPAIEENTNITEETQQAFIELQNYVRDYFNNLDVQDEINNKLDEMAEEGTLQEIISSYLNSKAVFCFDNVENMKNATNLINGSFAQTLGFYSKNDGGKSLYKIRNINNLDIVDEMFIISLNNENLVAELIEDDFINARQVGLYGDGIHDDTNKLQSVINSNKLLYLDGTYKISNSIMIDVGQHKGIKAKSGTSILGDFSNGGFSLFKLNNSLYDDSHSGRYGTVGNFSIENIYFSDITNLNETSTTHYGTGIEFINGCAGLAIKNCKFSNLVYGILISENSKGAYNDKFINCTFTHNDYGIYINALAGNDNGENFRFFNCGISTSKIGNYIGSDMYANFIESSFDYNLGNTFIVKDNALVSLTNCHIEWYASTPLIHIEYNGSLLFNSCNFIKSNYDDELNNDYFIDATLGSGIPEIIFNTCVFSMFRTYQNLCNSIPYIDFINCKRLEYNPSAYMNSPFTINLENAFNFDYPLNYNSGLTRNSTKVLVTATEQKQSNYLILPIDYKNSDAKIKVRVKSNINMNCKIDYATGQLNGEGLTNTTPVLSKTVSLTANETATIEFHFKLRRGQNLKPYLLFNLNELTQGSTFEVLSYSIQVI